MSTEINGLVLIVDDIPSNLDVVSDALSEIGCDVAIATSGERALQQIQRKPPDLILLDIMMPGIGGFETCRRLKANPATKNIPIIFMTALTDNNSKVQALDLGAVDYITKPFEIREIVVRVRTHIQLYQLTQNLEQQVAQKNAELQTSQLQLIQSEKMSSLGQLMAGVAHEINNPIGFVSGNLLHANTFINDLLHLVELYQSHYPDPVIEIQDEIVAIELDYLRDDLPKLIKSIKLGIDRIQDISKSLRIFSRSDSMAKVDFDVHDGIDSTILILKYRLNADENRPEIQIIKNYGEIPPIKCFPGQLNQVFMNLIINAIDMFDDMAKSSSFAEIKTRPQQIIISTKLVENNVQICIQDNGVGMNENIKDQIFDYLFTTKAVGKGTGLGLAIAKQIIEDKHQGTIVVSSEIGKGTEFTISIPLVVD